MRFMRLPSTTPSVTTFSVTTLSVTAIATSLVREPDNYTVVNITDYNVEDQLILYPEIIVHKPQPDNNTIIDIE
jgi:hypothetical protein